MEEKVKQQYDRWLSQSGMPADLTDELNSIAGNEDAITDRFYRELEFGTGGLRGVIGAGANRMNVYNIRKGQSLFLPAGTGAYAVTGTDLKCLRTRV